MKRKVGVGTILCALVLMGVAMLNGCSSGDSNSGPTFTLKSSNSAN